MAEDEQPESLEEIVRRVLGEQKSHGHRQWGAMDQRTLLTFQHQADAVLSQANPTSGTRYTVLATTTNVRIISITATVTWTGQPDPLEIHVTIDGVPVEFSRGNPVSAQPYEAGFPDVASDVQGIGTEGSYALQRAFLLEGRSVQITVETTGGAVSNLSARVKWARRL